MLKKVDLGAAANFGRSGTQSPTPQTSNDLLNDDFNPRDGDVQSNSPSAEFGDFEKAFGGTAEMKREDDDFADFSSAFTSQPAQQLLVSPPANLAAQTSLLGPAQPNLIGGIQPNLFAAQPPNLFASSPPASLSNPPALNNNASDLLGGFSSLTIQPGFASGAPVGNQPTSLLDGFDSGE